MSLHLTPMVAKNRWRGEAENANLAKVWNLRKVPWRDALPRQLCAVADCGPG
jgi:hypothetical protein